MTTEQLILNSLLEIKQNQGGLTAKIDAMHIRIDGIMDKIQSQDQHIGEIADKIDQKINKVDEKATSAKDDIKTAKVTLGTLSFLFAGFVPLLTKWVWDMFNN